MSFIERLICRLVLDKGGYYFFGLLLLVSIMVLRGQVNGIRTVVLLYLSPLGWLLLRLSLQWIWGKQQLPELLAEFARKFQIEPTPDVLKDAFAKNPQLFQQRLDFFETLTGGLRNAIKRGDFKWEYVSQLRDYQKLVSLMYAVMYKG